MAEASPLSASSGAAHLSVAVEQRFASGFAIDARLEEELAAAAVLVLFGPSAAGKTTILRQIAGLEPSAVGTISFAGEVWLDTARQLWRPPQTRGIGLVFQDATLFPHLTVRDNVRYGIRLRPEGEQMASRPRSGEHQIAEIENRLGVAELGNRHPRALSGGEAQRVALARALATEPRLLLLDEPFASLDAPARLRLRRDVRALLKATGTPAILVTHDRAEALAMGDTVAIVIDGRIRQVGGISDVFSRPADAEVAASLGIEAVLPARVTGASGGVVQVAVGEVMIDAVEREPMAAGAAVYACLRAEDVTLETLAAGHASTRNHLAATVLAIASEGPVDRVTLDCGFLLDALITRRSREELQLAPGAHVTAAIKATSVHLVPRV